jgi:hypothetical protein
LPLHHLDRRAPDHLIARRRSSARATKRVRSSPGRDSCAE